MEIGVDLSSGVPVVRLQGDMRFWNRQAESDQVREALHALMAAGHKRLLLNLCAVTRIDSRGIGCLARCHATAITSGAEISLITAPGIVLDTLKQLNFVRLYPIYSDEASALANAKST